jgi:hypothetical protein
MLVLTVYPRMLAPVVVAVVVDDLFYIILSLTLQYISHTNKMNCIQNFFVVNLPVSDEHTILYVPRFMPSANVDYLLPSSDVTVWQTQCRRRARNIISYRKIIDVFSMLQENFKLSVRY